tara:strand:+ start:733 stop:909 length:177 start_codon:yes stop_codon:yes gene_type:complete
MKTSVEYRKDFQDNFDNLPYLKNLIKDVVALYHNQTNSITYTLLDSIDNRILEIENGR